MAFLLGGEGVEASQPLSSPSPGGVFRSDSLGLTGDGLTLVFATLVSVFNLVTYLKEKEKKKRGKKGGREKKRGKL